VGENSRLSPQGDPGGEDTARSGLGCRVLGAPSSGKGAEPAAEGRGTPRSGGEEAGCPGCPDLVLEQRERVHHQGVPEQIDSLAAGADRVGPAEEERVIESPVDGLGVVAPTEKIGEDRVGGCDRPEVLGPVQLPLGVLVVAVQTNGDGAAAKVLGQGVLVVPTKRAGLVARRIVWVRRSSSNWSRPSSAMRPTPRAPSLA